MSEALSYEVVKPLRVPGDAHLAPLPQAILAQLGATDSTARDLLLAQVGISGTRIDGDWHVNAFDAVHPPQPEDEEAMYGTIAITGDTIEEPEAVLGVAERWMRDSEDRVWMPFTVAPQVVAVNAVAGLTLMRAKSAESILLVRRALETAATPAPEPAPKPGGLRRLLGARRS